jgi:alginate O-acetyltransferase complex protein AlgI
MLFSSIQFLVFLGVTFALWWTVPAPYSVRKIGLLLASALFYCAWNWKPYFLIVYLVSFDYWIGRGLRHYSDPTKRKVLLWISVANNLGVLVFFKYINLLIDTAADLLAALSPGAAGEFLSLIAKLVSPFGITMSGSRLDVLLPLGLSFTVFQTLSVTIDTYRRTFEGAKKWSDFLLYISFFPHIIAGPIVRGSDLLPQLQRVPTLTADAGAVALLRIAKGLAKKLLIADFLAANIIDRVFATPGAYLPLEVWTGVFAYTLQIYYDFSAYSDVAIGCAALFGYHFKENFARPYKATSLNDFWRRWHISLSAWLRDYLYISLGGNRGGMLYTVRNTMITMILGGIWHGATWRMALWGATHGIGISIARVFWGAKGMPEDSELPRWRVFLGWFGTFMSVMLARIYFRADSMTNAHAVFAGLVGDRWGAPNVTPLMMLILGLATVIHFGPDDLFDRIAKVFLRLPVPARAVAFIALALVVKHVASFDVQPFIYFQF